MRILILGCTGFVGTPLAAALLAEGHTVTSTTRKTVTGQSAYLYAPKMTTWNGQCPQSLACLLAEVDAVINLQGENIGAKRWTALQKQRIRQSRVLCGEALSSALEALHREGESLPHTLLQASACGYYGAWQDMRAAPLCTEHSPAGAGFLADTCILWEKSTDRVEELGVRRCVLRFGPVLGRSASGVAGGILARMIPFFQMFLGGPLGSGHQPVSWVHMNDVIGAVEFLLQHRECSGVFNVSAPQSVSMKEFANALGQALRRPALLRVPSALLRLALGEMAGELVLAGQRVQPAALLNMGYDFRQVQLLDALREVLE